MTLRPRYPVLFILSLLSSIMLWYTVAGQRRELSLGSVYAPLTLEAVPPNLVLKAPPPEKVRVQLQGPLSQSGKLAEQVKVKLNLSNAVPGRHTYQITRSEIEVPANLTVVSVDPEGIELDIERREMATLPVQAVITGAPATGFVIGNLRTIPQQVAVQGPSSQMAGLKVVTTSPVSVEGATSPVEETVRLILPWLVQPTSAGQVLVYVEVVPEPTPTPTPEIGY